MNRLVMRATRPGPPRPAAVLVSVLVVLIIVGMLTAQTVHVILVSRRAAMQSQNLQQARELIQYARLASEHGGYTNASFLVELVPQQNLSGQIQTSVQPTNGQTTIVRIVATYPVGKPNAVVASMEFEQ